MNADKKRSGLGLDELGDLSAMLEPPAQSGRVSEISLDLIDEDPAQPRTASNPGFSKASLNELAQTIKNRGVKTAISVRPNPDAPGRYLINHGARRFRASKIAGHNAIPANIDSDYSEADQVIENLHRNDLTSREIADYIGRRLAAGKKKSEVAKELGKSAAFVTQHSTLLDLPEPIAEAFNAGRTSDVTVVNDLVTIYKRSPDDVTAWLADDTQDINRGAVRLLREYLEEKQRQAETDTHENDGQTEENEAEEMKGQVSADDAGSEVQPPDNTVFDEEGQIDGVDEEDGAGEAGFPERDPNTLDAFNGFSDSDERRAAPESQGGAERTDKPSRAESDPDKLKRAIVVVEHDGRKARLMLDRRPPEEGMFWLKYEDDGHEFAEHAENILLAAIIEG